MTVTEHGKVRRDIIRLHLLGTSSMQGCIILHSRSIYGHAARGPAARHVACFFDPARARPGPGCLGPVMPVFLSYLNCITNSLFKNLLKLFRRLSSRSPPPDFPPFRHRAVSSSFSAEPPIPFPFPLAPSSRYITIVSRSTTCACPAMIVGAARVSPLFFSHILFKSILFLSSNFFPRLFFALASSFFFSPVLPAVCSSCSPLLARTRGQAHDPPLPPLLAVHARSHHAARVTPRPPRPLRACCPCTPSRHAARYYASLSPSRPLTLAACV
jgi:hypothetical protein